MHSTDKVKAAAQLQTATSKNVSELKLHNGDTACTNCIAQ